MLGEIDCLCVKQSLFIFHSLSLTRSFGLLDSSESCLESLNNHIWSETIKTPASSRFLFFVPSFLLAQQFLVEILYCEGCWRRKSISPFAILAIHYTHFYLR